MKHSQVVALNEISGYVQDSVVSRTLVKNDAGNITFFAFGKGQGLSKHSAPFDAFIQLLDGEAIIIIDETQYPMKAGESILMPANVPHAVQSVTDFKMMLVMLKG